MWHMPSCVYVVLSCCLMASGSRHFQCGVSNFLLERYDQALQNFEDAYRYLRGNEAMSVFVSSPHPGAHPPLAIMNKSASSSSCFLPKSCLTRASLK